MTLAIAGFDYEDTMSRILFAGDHEYRTFLSERLSRDGHRVTPVSRLRDIMENPDGDPCDVVVASDALPESEKQALLDFFSSDATAARLVFLPEKAEAAGEEQAASDALICLESISQALWETRREQEDTPENRPVSREAFGFQFGDFIGESDAIRKISTLVSRVAGTDSTVLITGESGTGKELIARAIHANSPRRHAPMITINCGAIPRELLESELFGHEKGSFTGAHRTRVGRFELADGGTIFLDEIGDMSPDLQVKLLRVLQEKCLERVGGTRPIHVNVRIISATNKDLRKAIKDNTFREDLYYRLNVIPIIVPPLRDRKNDIPLLIEHFTRKLDEKNSWGVKLFSPDAMAALCRYDWQGNVRELENMMERISVLVDKETVDLDDLPDYISGLEPDMTDVMPGLVDFFENGLGFNEAVEEHQKKLILHALNKTNWVKAKAADMLKMKRTTLVEKIKKMNLLPDRDDWADDDEAE